MRISKGMILADISLVLGVFLRVILLANLCSLFSPAYGAEPSKTALAKEACGAVLRFLPITRTIVEKFTRPSDKSRFQKLTRIENPPEIDLFEMRKLYLRDSAAMLTRLKSKYKMVVLLTDTHMTHREAMNAPLIYNWPSFWQYFHTPFVERKKIADAQRFYQAIFQANPWLGVYFAPHSPIPMDEGLILSENRPFGDQHVILIPQHSSRIVILHEFMHSRIAAHTAELTGDEIPYRVRLLVEALQGDLTQLESAMVKIVKHHFDEELAIDEWMLNNRAALNLSEEETKWLLSRYWFHPKQIRAAFPEGSNIDQLVQDYQQSLIRFVKKDLELLEISLRLGFISSKTKK